MTYHIKTIINNSPKAMALTNPHSNPDGRDSRLTLPGQTYNPPNPVEVNFIKTSGTVDYNTAVKAALNAYTFIDNFCFWDNGNSALNGVSEDKPNSNISYYNGPGGNLKMTINKDGTLSFAAA